jgi:hypothetical protein
MAIAIEPLSVLFGIDQADKGYQHRPGRAPDEPSGPGDLDLTVYPLKRWISLAMKGDPTSMMAIWSVVIEQNKYGQLLRKNADKFVSRQLFPRHIGYAESQLRRLEAGNYHKSRAKIVEAAGYDVKFAMHALRLVTQAQELAETKMVEIPIPEPRATLLRSLRRGEIPKEDFYKMFNEELEKLRKLEDVSTLPLEVDRDWVNGLLRVIYSDYYSDKLVPSYLRPAVKPLPDMAEVAHS